MSSPRPTDRAAWLAAVEAQFLAAMATGATTVETPAFRVHLWPEPDPFYRNVAVPTHRVAKWAPAIAAMRQAFAAADRAPRLEFLEDLWPDLSPALIDAGFAAASRMPVMIATDRPPESPADPASGRPVTHLDGATGREVLEAYLEVANAAFGQPLPPATRSREVALLESGLERGRCRIGVIFDEAGDVLAGAGLIGITSLPLGGGAPVPVAELAGVWTAADHRRCGLARRVTAAVLDRFASAGGVAWLAAEEERSAALYARLGFREIGHQRTFSEPAA